MVASGTVGVTLLAGLIVVVLALLPKLVLFLPVDIASKAFIFRIAFLSVIQTFVLIGTYYVWRQASAALKSSNKASQRGIKFLLICFLLCTNASYGTGYILGSRPHWFSHLCYACLGIFFQCNICLLALHVIHFILKVVGIWTEKQNISIFKNESIHIALAKPVRIGKVRVLFAFTYALCIGIYGLYNASKPPEIKKVNVPMKGLPPSMVGLKIVQINDIHLGPTVSKEKLQQVVQMVNSLSPDVVVVVGDLVDGSVEKLSDIAQPLADIKAKQGQFYVTGNHEYYTGDVDAWLFHLASLGFTVLHNQHAKVYSPRDSSEYIYIAGVDDIMADKVHYTGHGMDLAAALDGCRNDRPVILLAHQPNAARMALDSSQSENIRLVLSGHTHGGQVFPFTVPVYLFNAFVSGLYKYGGSYVYVSQGTVYWGIPMRIGTTREITLLTLV